MRKMTNLASIKEVIVWGRRLLVESLLLLRGKGEKKRKAGQETLEFVGT